MVNHFQPRPGQTAATRLGILIGKHGLVSPVVAPKRGGYYFNDEAIRARRRIEYLRTAYGVNLAGIKMILEFMDEVKRLRAETRFLRG